MNWLLTLAYDGTSYSGWQIQPERATIQGVVQNKISDLFQSKLHITGCSRTDAGVHALAQKVSFSPPERPAINRQSAWKALNSLLPPDIKILSIDEVSDDFHAGHEAVGKAYSYLLYRGKLLSPFMRNYFWPQGCSLNLKAMMRASNLLIGTHNFIGFSVNTSNPEINPLRTLYGITVKQIGSFLMISIIGNSFLYKMMRRIVGFLVKVGKEQIEPGIALQILNTTNRTVQFDTAPASGLYLEEVFYQCEEISRFQSWQIPFLKLLGLPDCRVISYEDGAEIAEISGSSLS